jgi:hypothetical protein
MRENLFKNLLTKVFYKSNSTYKEIEEAGGSVMCIIFGGLPSDGIGMLRYNIKKKLNNANVTKAINPQNLPPTKGALKYHCRRANLQVLEEKRLFSLPIIIIFFLFCKGPTVVGDEGFEGS